MSSPSPPTPEPSRWRLRLGCLPVVFVLSVLLNVAVVLIYLGVIANPLESAPDALRERFLLGDPDAKDKVAVVRVSGILTEAGIQFPIRQLEAAAKDKTVKAVVLRVDTPGGTVFASDELYQNVINLRDDTGRRFKGTGPKPVSVSMGSVAASGGYYVAVAGKPISAETTTITGSIGVFAALPNVAGLAERNGVRVELIKAGGIKAAGSFFHLLSQEERQTWQDTVDNAYDRFLEVIVAGRPPLTAGELRDKVVIDRMVPKRNEKGNVELDKGNPVEVRYTRVRADGGTFTAADAQKFGLIDKVEDLPATIRATASSAGLSSFKAVLYERTPGLLERVTGLSIQSNPPFPSLPDANSALTPRLWYLLPSADVGILLAGP